jgi:hypothetical protein
MAARVILTLAKYAVKALTKRAPKVAVKEVGKKAVTKNVKQVGKQAAAKTKGCVKGCPRANKNVKTIAGRKPINSKYAGKTHPTGVRFKKTGFPDFTPHAKAQVKFAPGKLGGGKADFSAANKKLGFPKTPKGYTWHHVEDGRTLQLVPTKLHDAVRHSGGASIIRNLGSD